MLMVLLHTSYENIRPIKYVCTRLIWTAAKSQTSMKTTATRSISQFQTPRKQRTRLQTSHSTKKRLCPTCQQNLNKLSLIQQRRRPIKLMKFLSFQNESKSKMSKYCCCNKNRTTKLRKYKVFKRPWTRSGTQRTRSKVFSKIHTMTSQP